MMLRRLLPALLCLLALTARAGEEQVPPDLYQEALQSISEGRNQDAYETLKRLIEGEPTHAGAWLEVALIQCSLGNGDEAERLFAEIERRFQPSPAIRALISKARSEGCSTWNAHRQANLSLARGLDHNVNQGATNPVLQVTGGEITLSDEFLPKPDHYTVFSGDYLRDISRNGSVGYAQFSLRKNDRLHQYDTGSVFIGTESPWRLGAWTVRTNAMLGAMSLGGRLYQRQLQLQARVGPPLPLPGSLQAQLLAGFNHVDYMTLTHFDTNTWEMRAILNYRAETRQWTASFGVLDDKAHELRPGGDRHGQQASLVLRQALPEGAGWIDLSYTRQTWQSQRAYAAGLIDTTRAQRTHALRAAWTYPVAPRQSLQLEVRRLVNRENISIFQYNNRLVQLSWQWQAP
ncbi:tetratricopeptide repeat protein [Massilia sp. TS11]|uniref:tetratricopeptide repeat protein n=1 Tax=Massilia sp. TS11 TaxID=2908003 RepID=UPI001EDA9AF8|nr:tetratricopeptide repeat protein [Massilia sp. TS11]MCG2583624.1 tetratricopeptide repeat protein [Massilia sp. TS11]